MGVFQEYPNAIVTVTLLEMQYELSPFVYTEVYFCVVQCMKLVVRPFSLLGRNYGFLPLRLRRLFVVVFGGGDWNYILLWCALGKVSLLVLLTLPAISARTSKWSCSALLLILRVMITQITLQCLRQDIHHGYSPLAHASLRHTP